MGMDEAWPWSFTAARRSRSGVQLGPRGTGGRGSTVSSSGGGNGVGGGVFWHGGGLARLGKGRGAECEGGTPLGEARGRESSAGRGGVEEGKRRRARGLAVACSPGGLDGQL